MTLDTVEAQGSQALKDLATRLAALDPAGFARPHADPQSAAVTALLVADYLAQPDLSSKLASCKAAKVSAESVAELRKLGHATMAVVARLGGDYLPGARSVPNELLLDGRTARKTVSTALEKARPDDAEVRQWVETIKLGTGNVDLLYDLRALGELCARHEKSLAPSSGLVRIADGIEEALRKGDTDTEKENRDTLTRLWTLFAPAYEAAAAAGRELTNGEKDRLFPPLALITAHRRGARRRSLEPQSPLSRKSPPASLPGEKAGNKSEPPPSSRYGKRHPIEIEVGITSDSNLYLGFTENLSAGGVFVATYVPKPIGSKLQISLTFPTGEEINTKAVVRWLRDAVDDGWPGMGVQFEKLDEADEAKLRKFLSMRDPMFYDDD